MRKHKNFIGLAQKLLPIATFCPYHPQRAADPPPSLLLNKPIMYLTTNVYEQIFSMPVVEEDDKEEYLEAAKILFKTSQAGFFEKSKWINYSHHGKICSLHIPGINLNYLLLMFYLT